MKAHGLTVEVCVDNQPLPEYAVTSNSPEEHICYIEAQHGKKFSFSCYRDNSTECSSAFALSPRVDGVGQHGLYLETGEDGRLSGSHAAKDKELPWVFAPLETLPSVASSSDPAAVSDIGGIQINVYRCSGRFIESSENSDISKPRKLVKGVPESKQTVHLSSQIKNGDSQATSELRWGAYPHRDKDPFLKMKFYYRTHEMLQRLDIIPADESSRPSTATLQGDTPIMTSDEVIVKQEDLPIKRERIEIPDEDDDIKELRRKLLAAENRAARARPILIADEP